MGGGPEHANGQLILDALNGIKPPRAGAGGTPNQLAQCLTISYARREAGSQGALHVWFQEQKTFGQWTGKRGKMNEQTTSSHDALWTQAVTAALWLALQRGDGLIEADADEWIYGYMACCCAGATPDGRVILPGARVTGDRPTSESRDDIYASLRNPEYAAHGRDWPKYRDQIGPALINKLVKLNHLFGGARSLTPENCGSALPKLVNRMTVQRYQYGHIATTAGEWPAGLDYARTAWAQAGVYGFVWVNQTKFPGSIAPPSEGWGELMNEHHSP